MTKIEELEAQLAQEKLDVVLAEQALVLEAKKALEVEAYQEAQRVQDLRDRVAALSDHNAVHSSLNPNSPNKVRWVEDNVHNADSQVAESNMLKMEAADAEIKQSIKDTKWISDRQAAYPSIEDQLDIIYHSGIDSWKEVIKAVKDAHPKT